MTVYGGSDIVSCCSFPTSLKGPAVLWFAKLKPNSIRSFTELAKAFVSHFQSSVKQKKTATNLLAIKQHSDESIRDYIARFNVECLEIKDLDDAMAFNSLHNGVTNHDLVKLLALDPVMAMPQLLDPCYQYANMFDIMKARKAVNGKAPEKKGASEKDEKKKDTKRTMSDRDQSPDSTPLNTTRTKILMEVYDWGLLQWPQPMFSRPEDRNNNKFCKFHKDVGHDSEDCRPLKREIEDVIQKGYLRRYVKEDAKAMKLQETTDEGMIETVEERIEVTTMIGGTIVGRSAKTGMRTISPLPLPFSPSWEDQDRSEPTKPR
ncbi:uncharacterized protein LOC122668525 [Telopea speciosissima]|uniref:uncharacterized protein LOC122668525 n=1 Tax=Telopea speciosissima TaxID=54955 RepID=UPI001CC75CDD|nr:uncharacterized protein LOC122668525 [Telopea speciosissima]